MAAAGIPVQMDMRGGAQNLIANFEGKEADDSPVGIGGDGSLVIIEQPSQRWLMQGIRVRLDKSALPEIAHVRSTFLSQLNLLFGKSIADCLMHKHYKGRESFLAGKEELQTCEVAVIVKAARAFGSVDLQVKEAFSQLECFCLHDPVYVKEAIDTEWGTLENGTIQTVEKRGSEVEAVDWERVARRVDGVFISEKITCDDVVDWVKCYCSIAANGEKQIRSEVILQIVQEVLLQLQVKLKHQTLVDGFTTEELVALQKVNQFDAIPLDLMAKLYQHYSFQRQG
ncbi:MAG: hypothetical protein S4CHLAM102_01060 [Chlamydiia bacterium]|nr:hypothetical protein [Chlamydiia bacterium]